MIERNVKVLWSEVEDSIANTYGHLNSSAYDTVLVDYWDNLYWVEFRDETGRVEDELGFEKHELDFLPKFHVGDLVLVDGEVPYDGTWAVVGGHYVDTDFKSSHLITVFDSDGVAFAIQRVPEEQLS